MTTRTKTGGRKRGTPNKATASNRKWIDTLIVDKRELLEVDFEKLSPKERWAIAEKLMQYTTPKIQSIQSNINFDKMTDAQLDEIISQLRNGAEG